MPNFGVSLELPTPEHDFETSKHHKSHAHHPDGSLCLQAGVTFYNYIVDAGSMLLLDVVDDAPQPQAVRAGMFKVEKLAFLCS